MEKEQHADEPRARPVLAGVNFEAMLNSLLLGEAASYYARLGWPVFPLVGKVPYKETRGYKDATTDAATIASWWEHYPHANIGLPTGSVSGLLVVDIDPRHNGLNSLKELVKRFAPLPDTLLSRTAHGGLHRYYQYPQDGKIYPNTVQLADLSGIDIRGEGGYVVLPPSKLYNRLSYKWGKTQLPIAQPPSWLLSLLPTTQEKKESPQEGRFANRPKGEKWLHEAVTRATEGTRNANGFFLACQLRDEGLSEPEARDILIAYAQQVGQGKEPYTVKEAVASVRSAYKRPPRERARRNTP